MTALESNIVKTIKAGLLKEAARLVHTIEIRKRHGTAYSIKGDPDLYGVINYSPEAGGLGRHFEIEVKRPGEEPTPLQCQRIQEWKNAGSLAGWATNFEEAKRILWPPHL